MSTEQDVVFAPASVADMQFIHETLASERLDVERLEPQQFITIRDGDRIIAMGRVKPYQRTYELGSVWTAPEHRGRGLGERITRELIRRFPQDNVFLTTDADAGLPAYYERFGFALTEDLPDELVAKLTWIREIGLRPNPVGMVYLRRSEGA